MNQTLKKKKKKSFLLNQAITAVVLAPPLIPPRLSSLDLWDIGFASVYLQNFHKPDPRSAKKDKTKSRKAAGRKEKKKKKKTSKRGGGTYFAKALARAFLQLTFCAPTKLSTVTAMARSTSCEVQYSESRILQKDSLIRMMASRWRTCTLLLV